MANPMYILSKTRRYSSVRTSQWGMRCGGWSDFGACPLSGSVEELKEVPGTGAGFGAMLGDVNSGWFDILRGL